MKKPPYEKEALQRNIEQCLKNIGVFEQAIKKEYETIAKLKEYIADIERFEKWQ